jgi:hypothetical protein
VVRYQLRHTPFWFAKIINFTNPFTSFFLCTPFTSGR